MLPRDARSHCGWAYSCVFHSAPEPTVGASDWSPVSTSRSTPMLPAGESSRPNVTAVTWPGAKGWGSASTSGGRAPQHSRHSGAVSPESFGHGSPVHVKDTWPVPSGSFVRIMMRTM